MKWKFYLAIVIFFLPFLSQSQTYKKTLEEGKQWKVSRNVGLGAYWDRYYMLKCDTIINSKEYLKVVSGNSLLGFVREDTLTQQIFHVEVGAMNETLIVDYTLSVGDTFIFDNHIRTQQIVVKIDTMLSGGRIIHFEGYGTFSPYLLFIEGQGNGHWGVLTKTYFNSSPYDGASLIGNTGITCATPTPINKIETPTNLKIFPNPFYNELNIEMDFSSNYTNKKGYIYDIRGQLVKTIILEQTTTIPLEDLLNGVYILKIDGFEPTRLIKN